MRIDIMVDIETLGNKSDSTIIQIAAAAFDINTGEIFSYMNEIADIEQNKESLNVTGSTLKWWMKTNPQLLNDLLNGGTKSSSWVIGYFHAWLQQYVDDNDVYLWGNGILFDNKMIQHQMELNNLNYPIFYRNDRDLRTLVELTSVKFGISEKELRELYYDSDLTAHNAFDDVHNQIALAVGCYTSLIGLE